MSIESKTSRGKNFTFFLDKFNLHLISSSFEDKDKQMHTLLLIKNLVTEALPKMPVDYISRLVFDRRHYTFVVEDKSIETPNIAGCICFRPFLGTPSKEDYAPPPHDPFVEIAFCAVQAATHGLGIGAFMMYCFKNIFSCGNPTPHIAESWSADPHPFWGRYSIDPKYSAFPGVTHVITYADNTAIEYFKKMGFSQFISLAPSEYHARIKTYDLATLMACNITRDINYILSPEHFARAKKIICQNLGFEPRVYSDPSSFDENLANVLSRYHIESDALKNFNFRVATVLEIFCDTESYKEFWDIEKRYAEKGGIRYFVEKAKNNFYRNTQMLRADIIRLQEIIDQNDLRSRGRAIPATSRMKCLVQSLQMILPWSNTGDYNEIQKCREYVISGAWPIRELPAKQSEGGLELFKDFTTFEEIVKNIESGRTSTWYTVKAKK